MMTMMNCPACGETISIQLQQGDAATQMCPHCGVAVAMPDAIAELPTPQIPGEPIEQEHDSIDIPVDGGSADSAMCRAMPWLVSAAVHCAIALLLTVLIVVTLEDPPETFEIVTVGDPTAQPIIQRDLNEEKKEESKIELPNVRKSLVPVDDFREHDPSDTAELRYGTPEYDPGTCVGGGPTGGGDGPGGGPALFGNDLDCVIYVIDRSGSMHGSFADVQDELRKSISRLAMDRVDSQGNSYTQQFHVILFADGGALEIGGSRLADASDAHKILAIDELAAVHPLGQTDPLPALRKAFAELQRVPEGKRCRIELLTDGSFPDNAAVLALVERLNINTQAQINTVLYGNQSPQAAAVLREIARRNGGRYKYVSPDEL